MEIVNIDIHKDLINRCKVGDRVSQYKLYQLYAKAMFNSCIRLLNDKEWAEDVLQEAFLEAFTHLDSFRFDSTFGAWLKRIVVNRAINAINKRKIDLVQVDDITKIDVQDKDDCVDEDELKLSVEKIKYAMNQLADGYRVVFSLYLLEGYDHEEISEIMGISESTSKSQLFRAKQKVKEILLKT